MGSVQDYNECKKCSGINMLISYYKSGELYQHCERCGSYEADTLKRDENDELVKNEEGLYILEHESKVGHGTYMICSKDEHCRGGWLDAPLTDQSVEDFAEVFKKDDTDLEKSYVAKWENGKQTLLFGSKIPDMNKLSFSEL